MSKQDRVAPRTAADLESKYNFGKTFAEAMGFAQEAQSAAESASEAVNQLDEKLDQDEIFNRLTNNGESQGVYRGDDGQIYINASYIKAGELLADLISTGTLKSKDGTVQIDLNNNTVTISGTRTAYVHGIGDKAFKTQLVLSSSGINGYGENTQGVMERVLDINIGVGGLPSAFWNESWEENTGLSFGTTHGSLNIGESTAATVIYGSFVDISSAVGEVYIQGKLVSWRDNGDGTFTLIGT